MPADSRHQTEKELLQYEDNIIRSEGIRSVENLWTSSRYQTFFKELSSSELIQWKHNTFVRAIKRGEDNNVFDFIAQSSQQNLAFIAKGAIVGFATAAASGTAPISVPVAALAAGAAYIAGETGGQLIDHAFKYTTEIDKAQFAQGMMRLTIEDFSRSIPMLKPVERIQRWSRLGTTFSIFKNTPQLAKHFPAMQAVATEQLIHVALEHDTAIAALFEKQDILEGTLKKLFEGQDAQANTDAIMTAFSKQLKEHAQKVNEHLNKIDEKLGEKKSEETAAPPQKPEPTYEEKLRIVQTIDAAGKVSVQFAGLIARMAGNSEAAANIEKFGGSLVSLGTAAAMVGISGGMDPIAWLGLASSFIGLIGLFFSGPSPFEILLKEVRQMAEVVEALYEKVERIEFKLDAMHQDLKAQITRHIILLAQAVRSIHATQTQIVQLLETIRTEAYTFFQHLNSKEFRQARDGIDLFVSAKTLKNFNALAPLTTYKHLREWGIHRAGDAPVKERSIDLIAHSKEFEYSIEPLAKGFGVTVPERNAQLLLDSALAYTHFMNTLYEKGEPFIKSFSASMAFETQLRHVDELISSLNNTMKWRAELRGNTNLFDRLWTGYYEAMRLVIQQMQTGTSYKGAEDSFYLSKQLVSQLLDQLKMDQKDLEESLGKVSENPGLHKIRFEDGEEMRIDRADRHNLEICRSISTVFCITTLIGCIGFAACAAQEKDNEFRDRVLSTLEDYYKQLHDGFVVHHDHAKILINAKRTSLTGKHINPFIQNLVDEKSSLTPLSPVVRPRMKKGQDLNAKHLIVFSSAMIQAKLAGIQDFLNDKLIYQAWLLGIIQLELNYDPSAIFSITLWLKPTPKYADQFSELVLREWRVALSDSQSNSPLNLIADNNLELDNAYCRYPGRNYCSKVLREKTLGHRENHFGTVGFDFGRVNLDYGPSSIITIEVPMTAYRLFNKDYPAIWRFVYELISEQGGLHLDIFSSVERFIHDPTDGSILLENSYDYTQRMKLPFLKQYIEAEIKRIKTEQHDVWASDVSKHANYDSHILYYPPKIIKTDGANAETLTRIKQANPYQALETYSKLLHAYFYFTLGSNFNKWLQIQFPGFSLWDKAQLEMAIKICGSTSRDESPYQRMQYEYDRRDAVKLSVGKIQQSIRQYGSVDDLSGLVADSHLAHAIIRLEDFRNRYLPIMANLTLLEEAHSKLPKSYDTYLKVLDVLSQFITQTDTLPQAKDKEIVLFIGKTGAGKSTSANYVHGTRYHSVEIYDEQTGESLEEIKRSGGAEEIAAVGLSDFEAETRFPQIFSVEHQGRKLYFADLPGMDGTRAVEEELPGMFAIQRLAKVAAGIKAVAIFIDYPSLTAGRAEIFKKSLQVLIPILGVCKDTPAFKKTFKSVRLLFTKVPKNENVVGLFKRYIIKLRDDLSRQNKDGRIATKNGPLLCLLKLFNESQAHIVNILDQGESGQAIVSSLAQSSVLHKNTLNFLELDSSQKNFIGLLKFFGEKYRQIITLLTNSAMEAVKRDLAAEQLKQCRAHFGKAYAVSKWLQLDGSNPSTKAFINTFKAFDARPTEFFQEFSAEHVSEKTLTKHFTKNKPADSSSTSSLWGDASSVGNSTAVVTSPDLSDTAGVLLVYLACVRGQLLCYPTVILTSFAMLTKITLDVAAEDFIPPTNDFLSYDSLLPAGSNGPLLVANDSYPDTLNLLGTSEPSADKMFGTKDSVGERWDCQALDPQQLHCINSDASKVRVVSRLDGGAFRGDLLGDDYNVCEVNKQAELTVRHCVGNETEFVEYEQTGIAEPGLMPTLAHAGLGGAAFAAIPEAIGDALYLSGTLNERNASYVKQGITTGLILATGSWVSPLIANTATFALRQMGCAEEKAKAAGNAAGFFVTIANNLTPTGLAATGANYLGGRVGFWAEKQAVQHVAARLSANMSASC